MRKKILILSLCVAVAILAMPIYQIYAKSPYEGKQSEWLTRCAVPQDSEEAAQECREFKEYYTQQSSNLEQDVEEMMKKSDLLKEDLSNLSALIEELNVQMKELDGDISLGEENVITMQTNIRDLDSKILEKKAEMEEIDKLIKARMIDEQVNLGTNRHIDVLMGAKDITDFIRMVEGINLITMSDQGQIDKADQIRKEYKLQQDEQLRLKDNMELQLLEIEKQKDVVAKGKTEQEKMYAVYYEKQQNIMKEMETAVADIGSMQGSIAGINTSIRDDIFQKPTVPEKPVTPEKPNDPETPDIPETPENPDVPNTPETPSTPETPETPSTPGDGNRGWIKPISYAWYCGTWYYPNSTAVHLGADYSGPIGAAVVAPADSLVLYASDPFGASDFGQYLGWPYGAGNSMHLLTQVNGTTYGISYFHLSPGFLTSPGSLVKQGQVVAYSGNSGNSYGGHLHVEVINLGNMSVTQAQKKFANTADFAWGSGWDISSTCSTRQAPCRERPEDIFGY